MPSVVTKTGTTNPQHHQPSNPTGSAQTTAKKARRRGQGSARADRKFKYEKAVYPDLDHTPKFLFAVWKQDPQEVVTIDNMTSCTWEDANAITTGEMNVIVNQVTHPDGPGVREGDRILCACDEGGGFKPLWVLRVSDVQEVSANDGTWQFQLANDLDLLRRSDDFFIYRANKSHPGGWWGHDIIIDVARRYGITIGGVYRSKTKMTIPAQKPMHGRMTHGMKTRMSPLDVIRNVVLQERRLSGRRLVVRYEYGSLYVLPLTRNPSLLALGPTLNDMQMESRLLDQFASSVQLWGLKTAPGDKFGGPLAMDANNVKKPWVDITSPKSVARYGFVHKILYSPDARNRKELKDEAQRFLTAVARPWRTVTLTHQILPRVRRGDAITLQVGPSDIRHRIVWVGNVTHTLDATGQYQTTLTLIFTNPFNPKKYRIYWKLKATKQEAVGDRLTRNPAFYVRGDNKSDKSGAKASFSDSLANAWMRGATLNSGLGPGVNG